MARPRRTPTSRSTDDYRHEDARRKNNPPVGMAAYEAKTAEQPRAHYGYDPHLSPQLIWAGKPGLVNIEVEDAAGVVITDLNPPSGSGRLTFDGLVPCVLPEHSDKHDMAHGLQDGSEVQSRTERCCR